MNTNEIVKLIIAIMLALLTGCKESEMSIEEYDRWCKFYGASNCSPNWKMIYMPRPAYGETILLKVPGYKKGDDDRWVLGFRHSNEQYFEHTKSGDIPCFPKAWDVLPAKYNSIQ